MNTYSNNSSYLVLGFISMIGVTIIGCSSLSGSNKHFNEGEDLRQKGEHQEAILSYTEALKIDPDNLDAINNKGYALSKLKDYKNAIDCYNHGLKIAPSEESLLINKISALRKLKMLDEALQNCDFFLNDNPDEFIAVSYTHLRAHET